jgi:GNAT superfamily N-acetyltransferase
MPDMLVQLLKIPPVDPTISKLRAQGIVIRRANAHEISRVREFVLRNFAQAWADEILVGFSRQPISVFIAIREGELIGFGAYECTRRSFFGPTGVIESERGKGIGRALLLACLRGLREMGYAYAVIGGAGPVEFYERECGATIIPDSVPGVYADPLKKKTTKAQRHQAKPKKK